MDPELQQPAVRGEPSSVGAVQWLLPTADGVGYLAWHLPDPQLEALLAAGLTCQLSIRFWLDAPETTRARRALEQALIQRWLPPFNKETRSRWATQASVGLLVTPKCTSWRESRSASWKEAQP